MKLPLHLRAVLTSLPYAHAPAAGLVALSALLLAVTAARAQTPSFAPVVEYTMGQDSQDFTVGDFNRDGNLDVITTSFYDSILYFRLGNGDGTFQAATSLADAGNPNDVKTADLNGDGYLDLVSTRVVDNVAVVRLGNGDGTFQAAATYPVGNQPYFLVLGDLNGNSVVDLVVSHLLGNDLHVLLGNGDGTFGTGVSYPAPAGSASVRVIRSDNSGVKDLAVVGSNANLLSIFPGNGDGTFGTKTDYSTGVAPYNLANGDLNGDGFDDIVVPHTGGNTFDLFLARGDGTYNSPTSVVAGDTPNGAEIADLNSDSFADVAVSNTVDNTIQIYTGDGTGTLTSAALLNTGPITVSVYVQAVDLNKDGLLDLIVSKWGTGTGAIDVYLNTTPAAEIDVKGNGTSIVGGATTPSRNDYTDFGSAAAGSGYVERSFQVENSGAYALRLLGTAAVTISGPDAADFSVTGQPSSPIGVNATSGFNIRFAPTTTGVKTATVTVANTDPDEGSYTFALQGTGITPPSTQIAQKPRKTLHVGRGKERKRVTFKFRSTTPGASFLCKLQKPTYSACSSPKSFNLKRGRYTFRVKAVIDGVSDLSSAVYRFEVK